MVFVESIKRGKLSCELLEAQEHHGVTDGQIDKQEGNRTKSTKALNGCKIKKTQYTGQCLGQFQKYHIMIRYDRKQVIFDRIALVSQ